MWDLSQGLTRVRSFCYSPWRPCFLEDERPCGEKLRYPSHLSHFSGPSWDPPTYASARMTPRGQRWSCSSWIHFNCWPTESQANCYFKPLRCVVVSHTGRGSWIPRRWIVPPLLPSFLLFNHPPENFSFSSLGPLKRPFFCYNTLCNHTLCSPFASNYLYMLHNMSKVFLKISVYLILLELLWNRWQWYSILKWWGNACINIIPFSSERLTLLCRHDLIMPLLVQSDR